ncbi:MULTISPECIES: DUF3892 domain-containing protein [Caloramator]|uniref:DUF3892 domain-containing protein n=1 Tax=Caloramator australicus RC3 TaxID=857293 RepID=I7LFU7_9CLOT|nr:MULTISPECIES: DUF3892 domain-containing protein [Caloramator]WDU82850.1 DUF3892 domain-containing protein [Caloramator sp. Dgby_cultured_2]CCJ32800.1 hypothetical protein CAAU_0716 [Caloramator australicus RC3]
MHRITGVKHDEKGEIVAYRLDNGQVVSKEEGIRLASEGQIEGVRVGTSKKGEKYLRSLPDGKDENNLDNLPEIQ